MDVDSQEGITQIELLARGILPFVVFALVAAAIGATGYVSFQRYKEESLRSAYRELSAVADLKVHQVAEWRAAQERNAEVLSHDPLLAAEVEQWLKRGAPDDISRQRIFQRLSAVQELYGYNAGFLLDERGNVRLSLSSSALPPTPYGRAAAVNAMRARQSDLTDLHKGAEAPRVRLDLLVPIVPASGGANAPAVAAIYFRLDPLQSLYPIIKSWPTASPSAEIMLVRREGGEIVYLNDLRFRDKTALNLSSSIRDGMMVNAVAKGGEGLLAESVDYRGVRVIAATRRVPDSPWFLIAKVDAVELSEPVHQLAWLVAGLALTMILATGLVTGFWWRHQRARLLVEQYQGELERQALVQHFNYLTRYANDIILLMDDTGRITEANERAITAYGYTHDELLQLTIRDVRAPEALADLASDWGRWNSDEAVFETVHRRKDGTAFPVEESARLIEVEGKRFRQSIIRDITERKVQEEKILYQATHDALTRLPNRDLLLDRLTQAIAYARRRGTGLGVAFLDLDSFMSVNDSLGHDIGDRLLRAVAERFETCVREDDTVARYTGDEFAFILLDAADENKISSAVQKIMAAVSSPFSLDGRELFLTCSVGIALYPRDGEDAQVLLKNANTALHRAKEHGSNSFQFYADEMNVKALERLMLENNLRHALERNELQLHYQPQVDIRSGKVIGIEALVRWQNPEFGLIPPAMFIPLAEETGLILEIGDWVLRTACAQNKAWQDSGLAPLRMAVNFSARQFKQPNVVETVAFALRESGLAPCYLDIELTESVLIHDADAAISTMRALRELGVQFSIDDFGTGYSSLSYLKRFPLNTLKIDRSFVQDVPGNTDDAAIAKAIISMAHDLKLKVIAEGVENEAQRTFLKQHHCDEMQGYYFSRPVCADEIAELLRNSWENP